MGGSGMARGARVIRHLKEGRREYEALRVHRVRRWAAGGEDVGEGGDGRGRGFRLDRSRGSGRVRVLRAEGRGARRVRFFALRRWGRWARVRGPSAGKATPRRSRRGVRPRHPQAGGAGPSFGPPGEEGAPPHGVWLGWRSRARADGLNPRPTPRRGPPENRKDPCRRATAHAPGEKNALAFPRIGSNPAENIT